MNIASEQAIWILVNLIGIIDIAQDKKNIIAIILEPQLGRKIRWHVLGIIYFIIDE